MRSKRQHRQRLRRIAGYEEKRRTGGENLVFLKRSKSNRSSAFHEPLVNFLENLERLVGAGDDKKSGLRKRGGSQSTKIGKEGWKKTHLAFVVENRSNESGGSPDWQKRRHGDAVLVV
jgi:hypothetical protein